MGGCLLRHARRHKAKTPSRTIRRALTADRRRPGSMASHRGYNARTRPRRLAQHNPSSWQATCGKPEVGGRHCQPPTRLATLRALRHPLLGSPIDRGRVPRGAACRRGVATRSRCSACEISTGRAPDPALAAPTRAAACDAGRAPVIASMLPDRAVPPAASSSSPAIAPPSRASHSGTRRSQCGRAGTSGDGGAAAVRVPNRDTGSGVFTVRGEVQATARDLRALGALGDWGAHALPFTPVCGAPSAVGGPHFARTRARRRARAT